jgi:hypothetical protein
MIKTAINAEQISDMLLKEYRYSLRKATYHYHQRNYDMRRKFFERANVCHNLLRRIGLVNEADEIFFEETEVTT